ncbi:putative metal-nicotianamine transporter YSL18 [Hordeum vulgare]|nr:putative metal-nicotianamine transporter YSL18 [Hordeum vulgare]
MSDFKTGYLTLTSPRALFVSQVIGTGIGCIVNPAVFTVFHHFYEEAGNKIYQVPLAKIYRAMAVIGVGHVSCPGTASA